MGGGTWADTFYTRREHARRERDFNQRMRDTNPRPETQAQVPSQPPASYSGPRPTRFDSNTRQRRSAFGV